MITLQSILEDIESRKRQLDIEYAVDPGYETCKEYVSHNRIQRIEDMMEIDPWAYMTCALYLNSEKGISIEEAAIISEACRKIFDDLEFDEFDRLLNSIIVLSDYPERKDFLDYITEPNKLHAGILLRAIHNEMIPLFQISKGDFPDIKLHDFLKELREIEQSKGGYAILYDFLEKETEVALNLFAFLHQHKKMIDDRNYVMNLGRKVKTKTVHSYYTTSYSFSGIKKDHDIVSDFVLAEERNKAEFDKTKRRALFYYDDLIRLLQQADRLDEIKNPREIIKHVTDEELKKKILMWIYQKNSHCKKQLESRLEELNSNSLNHYASLFKKYRINLDVSQIPSIMHHSLDDVETMLGNLPIALFTPEQILTILQVTDVSTVQKIHKYIDLEFLQPKVLVENIRLFQADGNLLKKLEESFELLNSYGINQKLFSGVPQILWDESDFFKQNIKYLCMYGLLRPLRSTSSYDFLLDVDMVEKIDLFVELGYYSYLIQNLDLLNYPKDRIKRLELLRAMSIPIDDIDTLYEVLDNKKFIVKDDELDQYLLDVVPYKEPLSLSVSMDTLEDFANDGVNLSIGNTIVSLPKIQRKMGEGYSLGEAIFYGRKYSEEEYDQMCKALSPYIRK